VSTGLAGRSMADSPTLELAALLGFARRSVCLDPGKGVFGCVPGRRRSLGLGCSPHVLLMTWSLPARTLRSGSLTSGFGKWLRS
jgi:hypothetical protein